VVVTVVSVTALLASYIIGTAARQIIRGRANVGDVAALSIGAGNAETIPGLIWLEGLWATRRLQGFDGLLAVNRQQPPEIRRVYRPSAFATRFMDELVPMSGAGPMNTGRAVSLYYSNLSPDADTAGSLGLMATLELMFGRWGALAGVLFLGLGLGVVWRLADRIRDPDARFIFLFITAYHALWVVMAGSLDMITARYVIALAQLVGLSVVMRVTMAVLKPAFRMPTRARPPAGEQPTSRSRDVGLAT